MLFDAPLQMKLQASRRGAEWRHAPHFTHRHAGRSRPFHAVTLVANHDTQPLSRRWKRRRTPRFKPLAYALILLREKRRTVSVLS